MVISSRTSSKIARRFNHKARSFSKINMACLASCSNIAYRTSDEIKQILEFEGFNLSDQDVFFEYRKDHMDPDIQGFIVGDSKKIIISFRDTESKFQDWNLNFDIMREDWTPENNLGSVHRGFVEGLDTVWATIKERLNRLHDNDQRIWITGHSLGGALATLAAATLELQENLPIAGVYTFGQPRLGNRELYRSFHNNENNAAPDLFERSLGKRTFRCVNNCDLVTRVPPQITGYRHVGHLIYFDHEGHCHTSGNLSRWATFWDRFAGRAEDILDFSEGHPRLLIDEDLEDHSIDVYEVLSRKLAGLAIAGNEAWRDMD